MSDTAHISNKKRRVLVLKTGLIGSLELGKLDGAELCRILPDCIIRKYGKLKSSGERELHLSGYLLLAMMYTDYINGSFKEKKLVDTRGSYGLKRLTISEVLPLPDIAFGEHGKPELCGRLPFGDVKLSFNISHTDGISAVCLTDEFDSVGIDIEKEKDMSADIDALIHRFAPSFAEAARRHPCGGSLIDGISVYSLSDFVCGSAGRLPFFHEAGLKSDTVLSGPLSRWTLLEAVLKSSGDGFFGAKEAERLLSEVKTATFLLEDGCGEKYSLSLAWK